MYCNLILLEIILLTFVICHVTGSSIKNNERTKINENEFTIKSGLKTTFSDWSKWSRCDRKCIKSRTRYCLDPEICIKKVINETKRCTRRGKSQCLLNPRKIRKDKAKQMEQTVYELIYGEWSNWSPCTRSCKKRRYRICVDKKVCKGTVLMEHRICFISKSSKCRMYRTPSKKDRRKQEHTTKKTKLQSKEEKKESSKPSRHGTSQFDSHGHYLEGCGIRNTSVSTRIIGGQESRHGSWPWQVAVLTQWKEQYCGGVMIAPQWVLTAAHCLRRRMRRVILRIGEHDFEVDHGTEQDFKINRNSAILHPDFNMEDIDSDIALVKLKEPIKEEHSMSYACIPQENDILHENTMCYVVGWGKMKETHLFGTNILQEAKVPLVSRTKCQTAFSFRITPNQMCAGHKHGGMDTCAGDSGGPLMCEIRKNGVKRWYVYGVTSFGEGCGDKGKYGIYTIVRNFNKWIKKTAFS